MSTDSYVTGGGIRVHRTVERHPRRERDRARHRRARHASRRAARVELRVSRALHALGHGVRRSAAGARGARPRLPRRGAERARRGAAAAPIAQRAAARSTAVERLASDRRRHRRRRCARRPAASPRRSAAASRRCSRVLRALVDLFRHPDEPHLGLYGAFGYDLAFQFEPIRLRLPRPADQRDLVLYLPDELVIVDHRREVAQRRRYEFEVDGRSTAGLPRDGAARAVRAGADAAPRPCDHAPGEYAAMVRVAREARSSAAICSRWCRARRSSRRARAARPSCSAACASATRRPTAS